MPIHYRSLACVLLLLALVAPPVHAEESDLTIQGWVTFETEFTDKGIDPRLWGFDLHHFNIVTSYIIDSNWRVIGEIEWEHGPARG